MLFASLFFTAFILNLNSNNIHINLFLVQIILCSAVKLFRGGKKDTTVGEVHFLTFGNSRLMKHLAIG